VIDCVGGTADIKKLSEDILLSVSNAARELRPQGSPKLTYIYTSGTWVHGENRNETVTDTTPIRSPPDLVAWRPGREQQVINDINLNGIVVRPGLLYGRSGSLFAPFFQSACEGNVWYPGQPGGRFALIHTDDLADLYLRAVEKAAICGGLIFDAANDQTESADDVLATLVKVSGAQKPYEYRNPSNGMFFPF
jgi:nucleoside-diphosphate-sugar epimerase